MSSNVARRLRPQLFHGFKRLQLQRTFACVPALRKQDETKSVTHDYGKRIAELEARRPLSECYPRLNKSNGEELVPLDKFRKDWTHLKSDATLEGSGPVKVAGM